MKLLCGTALVLLATVLAGCPAVERAGEQAVVKRIPEAFRKPAVDAAVRAFQERGTDEAVEAAVRESWREKLKETAEEKGKELAFDAVMEPFKDAWKACKSSPDAESRRACLERELNAQQ